MTWRCWDIPGIVRRSRIGILDVNEAEDRPKVHYCPNCELAGAKVRLGPRVYLPNEFGQVVIPPDADNWMQCHDCGDIVPKYEARYEGQLKVDEEFEIISNKFDFGMTHIEPMRESRRIDKSPTQIKAQRKRRKQQLDIIKDPDILAELSKGGEIHNYTVTKV